MIPENLMRLARRCCRHLAVAATRRFGWLCFCIGSAERIKGELFRHGTALSSRLLVFLPGIGDVVEDYEHYGFLDAVHKSGIKADMTITDLHFGYYFRRTIVERLREDIIHPARAAGYREIDLVGISLGGLGSLLYAMDYPGEIRGIYLLAPYLGDPNIISEISSAGGLRSWRPGEIHPDDFERRLWQWLKRVSAGDQVQEFRLGYGAQDQFAAANRLLAEVLPSDHVYTTSGTHDWRTWKRVWGSMVQTMPKT